MKLFYKIIFIFYLLVLFSSCSRPNYLIEEVTSVDSLTYLKTDMSLLNGFVYTQINDKKMLNGEYLNGYPNGIHKSWYINNQIKYEGNYLLGKKEGTWKNWNENGQLITEIDWKENKKKLYKEWDKNGKLISDYDLLHDSILNGFVTHSSETFTAFASYENGLLHGCLEVNFMDGNKWVHNYKNGKLDGINKIYKGELVTDVSTYKNGVLDGLSQSFHTDGNKWSEGNYKDGEKHGIWKSWTYLSGVKPYMEYTTKWENGKEIDSWSKEF